MLGRRRSGKHREDYEGYVPICQQLLRPAARAPARPSVEKPRRVRARTLCLAPRQQRVGQRDAILDVVQRSERPVGVVVNRAPFDSIRLISADNLITNRTDSGDVVVIERRTVIATRWF